MNAKNPKTEIGLVCGTKHVVLQRIQVVHDSFSEAAGGNRWTTASFLVDEDPPQRLEIPATALSYFRIVGDAGDHAL